MQRHTAIARWSLGSKEKLSTLDLLLLPMAYLEHSSMPLLFSTALKGPLGFYLCTNLLNGKGVLSLNFLPVYLVCLPTHKLLILSYSLLTSLLSDFHAGLNIRHYIVCLQSPLPTEVFQLRPITYQSMRGIYSFIHSRDLYSASSRNYNSEALPDQSRPKKQDFREM